MALNTANRGQARVKTSRSVANAGIDEVLGEGEKLITTVLLNGERLHVKVHANALTREVFDQVTRYIGLNEVQYFGLMIIKDGEHQFLDLEEKLSKLAKYAPHLWKDDSSWNSSLVFTLFFRVKFYVENICLLEEQATRQQYYLQLRKDVLENNIRIHDDTAMVLASYALQAELGDYDKSSFGTDYFVPQHYLPAKTIAKLTVPYIKSALPAMHQSHRGLTEAQASIEFLKEAQKLSEYGILFYRVFRKEYNRKVPYTLGVCVRGLIIYEDTGSIRSPFCKHPWAKIKKMSFKRRKFLIHADSPNPIQGHIVLYTANYKRSRYLLKTCSSFYNFQMHMVDKLVKYQDFFEPQRAASSVVPTVRIDPDGMPDMTDGRRTFPEREQDRKSKGSSVVKDQSKEKPKAKPQPKQYVVDLIKVDNSFGFSIVGGIELGGIFVKELTIGGPAAQSGQISAGDRIVQVNKVNFENVTRREAINTLRNAADRSKFTFETFGQTMLLEADPSILTPLTLSASSIATLGSNMPGFSGERESELVRVELPKKDGNFGIGFTGGPELGGIYIKSFLPGGSAEANGRIAIGDRLVEIGNTNVETFTRKQVQDMLRTSSNVVTLVLERYKKIPMNDMVHYIDPERVLASNPSFISVTLMKKQDGLGFSITGGHELGGIFIKSLNMNGPAAMDRRLEVGDRIVAVNNISLETATRPKALEVIRTATSPVKLIVEKCVPPDAREPVARFQDEPMLIHRSDSIKSLPTGYSKNDRLAPKARGLALSVQDIPGVSMGRNPNPVQFDFERNDIGRQGGMQQQQPTQQLQQYQYNSQQQDVSNQVYSQQQSSAYGNDGMNLNRKSLMPEVFVVDLPKVNGSFGLSLTGGPEVGGIFVKALQLAGAADRDGRIVKGDRLVEINGRRMDGYNKHDAIEMLKSSVGMATLIFERYGYQCQQRQFSSQMSSFDGDNVAVEIHKKKGSFGLCITGGPEMGGIYVKGVLPGGASEGKVAKGDRIVEINGVSMDGFTKFQCDEILRKTQSTVQLMIERFKIADEIPLLDGDLYCVELKRTDLGIGLTLTGGLDVGGIYVKGIMPDSPAEYCERIRRGDRVVEINGVSVEGLTKHQANDLFKRANLINILLEKNAIYDSIVIPESDFFSLELVKKNNSFGINLAGGPEIGGIYIKSLQTGGAAADDNRIQKGDRIIAVNGTIVDGMTRQQVYEILKGSLNKIVLYLERCVLGSDVPPLDTVLTVVELTKAAGSFGLSLMGGRDSGGIFVRAMLPNGSAEIDGRVQVGDKITEINGISLEGCSKLQAIEILKNSPQTATFILERYRTSPRRLNGSRQGSVASSMSVQSLNQSRSSIQSVGLEPSQSQLQSQIPSYCTLPRHSIGQNAAGSAFHPVARSAPATPKTERPLPRAVPKTHNQRSDVQVGRSMSQPSSPKSAPISSVYSVRRDTVTSADPLVQMLPARKSTVTSSGSLTRLSSLERSLEPPVSQPPGIRTAPSTPLKQSGLQWLPLSGNTPLNKDIDEMRLPQSSDSSRPIPISSIYTPTSSATLPRTLMRDISSENRIESGRGDVPVDVTDYGSKSLQSLTNSTQVARDQLSIYDIGSSARSQQPDVRSQHSELISQHSELRSQHSEARSLQSEIRSQQSEVRSQQSVYLTGQNISSTLSQTLPRGFGSSKEPAVASQPLKPSVYAPSSTSNPPTTRSLVSSLTSSTSTAQQQQLPPHQQVKPQPAPRTGSLRDIGGFNFPKGSILGSSVNKTDPQLSSTNVSDPKAVQSSVYSASKETSKPGSRPNDFASLHSSIYAATKQRSALNASQNPSTVSVNEARGQSSGDSRSHGYELSRGVNSSVYATGINTGQNSFESSSVQSNLSLSSDQNSFLPDPQSAIVQSTRSIIGIGHSAQSLQNIYSKNSSTHISQSEKILPNEPTGIESRQIPISSAPFIQTNDHSIRGSTTNRGQNSGPGLLKTSNQKQSSSIVDTLTNPFARQYPRPTVPAVSSDINDNNVTTKQQNGGVYQNSANLVSRRGSSGFHGISGDHIFEVVLYKGPVGLGLNLAGGSNEGPIRIKKIAKGSSADECGQLQIDDILLEVNGVAVEKLTSREVVGLLRSSPNEILLLVKREISIDQRHYQQPPSSYVGL